MGDINKEFYDGLAKLKPLLPKGYQRIISETVDGIQLYEVKRAFNGRLKNREKLLQIFDKANELAKNVVEVNAAVKQKSTEVIKAAGKL